MRNAIVFLYILYNSGLMQPEDRRKATGCKLLCFLNYTKQGLTQRPMQCVRSMRLTYLIPHVQAGCITVIVYLPKLAAPARTVRCSLFSSRDAGSVRSSYSTSVDDVLGLEVGGTTLRQATASAEGVGGTDRQPSYLRPCDVQVLRYCK